MSEVCKPSIRSLTVVAGSFVLFNDAIQAHGYLGETIKQAFAEAAGNVFQAVAVAVEQRRDIDDASPENYKKWQESVAPAIVAALETAKSCVEKLQEPAIAEELRMGQGAEILALRIKDLPEKLEQILESEKHGGDRVFGRPRQDICGGVRSFQSLFGDKGSSSARLPSAAAGGTPNLLDIAPIPVLAAY